MPIVCLGATLHAQQDRIPGPIDLTRTAVLRGHIHPNVASANDAGPADPSFNLPGMVLHLNPSADQKKALSELLSEQRDPSSPNYHKWLTPEEFAGRFG